MRIFATKLNADYGDKVIYTDFSTPVSMDYTVYDFDYGNNMYYLVGDAGEISRTSDFSSFTDIALSSSSDRVYRCSYSGIDFYGLGRQSSSSSDGYLDTLFYGYNSTGPITSVGKTKLTSISGLSNFRGNDVGNGGLIIGFNKSTNKGMVVKRTPSSGSYTYNSYTLDTGKLKKYRRLNSNKIAIGESGYVVKINDTMTFDVSHIDDTFNCNDIAYGNGKYVVVSLNGYYSTSTDLTNWTTPKKIHDNISDPFIVFAYNKFIVVDDSGRTISSYDGENWNGFKTIQGASQNIFKCIDYVNGDVIALGSKYSHKTWKGA